MNTSEALLIEPTLSLQQMINVAVAGNREPRKQTTWHASSLGQCLTGAYLKRAGLAQAEFDERTLRVFHAGKMFEDWVVSLLEKVGKTHETQVHCVWSEKNVSGYADLLMDEIVYEIKSKHSKSFWYMDRKKEGAPLHHKMQLWIYLKSLGKPKGEIIYISKDDMAILQYPIFLNDTSLEKAVLQEVDILNAAWEKQLPPEPVRDEKDWRHKYCSCHELCLSQAQYLPFSLPH